MDSRRGSIAIPSGYKRRKSSAANARYARQASLSLQLEQGRLAERYPRMTDASSPTLFDNYVIGQKIEGGPPLKRATTDLGPLEEHHSEHRPQKVNLGSNHPGDRWSARRATESQNIVRVPGAFEKPFEEPDLDMLKPDPERQHSTKATKLLGGRDAELAQIELQRVVSEAKQSQNVFTRIYRQLLGKDVLRYGVANGLGFAATLPTAHASAVLHHVNGPPEESSRLYVLEYRYENQVLASSTLKPFDRAGSLKAYLNTTKAACDLRVMYSCNNEEAVNIRAAGKAVKWRPSYDAGRNLICSAFGLDFGKILAVAPSAQNKRRPAAGVQLTESSHRQRVAVYMQRTATTVTAAGARAFRLAPTAAANDSLPAFASCPTILIARYSGTNTNDVLSMAAALLSLDNISAPDLSTAIIKVTQDIVLQITEGIQRLWHQQVHLLHEPHAELEDHIFSQPSDPSRAREIWAMSQRLHEILKLLNRHTSLIEDVQDDFRTFAERFDSEDDDDEWLDPTLATLTDLSEAIDVDYVQPMDRMMDLMYKSVTIRDSRQSLELNASLWRLSWITFIFLPLTALSGFFGMNVDTFNKGDPSIKWYFVAAAPLLVLVVAFWFSVRTFAPASKRADMAMEIAAEQSERVDDGADGAWSSFGSWRSKGSMRGADSEGGS
ncbi:uncharacterized protein AB675_371 [Cyphellophora attinorum]|uniref:Magnesium transport protein CorA n=1 Tax=Cyphellophora attinorum TaxID=1664694 RepID=A0A0N1HGY9_9EURO|nr:uncharacterized protein AB675_371 [Phialophora attinorum]KPI45620.1 hypothetical protein AB675_371 [Phialophora attinorum]